jgi:Mg2+ and Co2+ transporter CorA
MVNSVFSDKFMVALSVVIIPIILAYYFFKLTPVEESFLNIVDWVIVVLFVLEYVLKLYLARNRWQHFKSPWNLVDLFIIVVPFVQLTQVFSLGLQGHPSLLLRLLTIPRAFAIGGRAAIGRRQKKLPAAIPAKEPETVIMQVSPDRTVLELSWDQLREHVEDSGRQEWFDIRNISDEGFSRLSEILIIPEPQLKSGLIDEIYPHIDHTEDVSFIFLQSGKVVYPQTAASYLTVARSGVVVIYSRNKIFTVSKHNVDLVKKALDATPKAKMEGSFTATTLYAVLMSILNDYKKLLSESELEVLKIGSLPKAKLPKDFLERMYRFEKEINRVESNLAHFKEMLTLINSGNILVDRFSQAEAQSFHVLQDTVTYLNDLAEDLVGNMQGIIDLYINQTSFDTNRILKILAVITAISVIPSSIGGVMGMNLLDVPFGAVLWQMVLVIGIIMAFMAYVTLKLGWLKT